MKPEPQTMGSVESLSRSGARPAPPPQIVRASDRAWLEAFEICLSTLPDEERMDLVAEHRAHLAETEVSPEHAFGEPERYAERFVGPGVGAATSRSWLGWGARLLAIVPALAALLLGLIFFTTGIADLWSPQSTGLFMRDGQMTGLGIGFTPSPGEDVLGRWVLPLFGGLGSGLIYAGLRGLDWIRS